jgi:hypothetical protein
MYNVPSIVYPSETSVAVSSSQYTTSNDWMTASTERERCVRPEPTLRRYQGIFLEWGGGGISRRLNGRRSCTHLNLRRYS